MIDVEENKETCLSVRNVIKMSTVEIAPNEGPRKIDTRNGRNVVFPTVEMSFHIRVHATSEFGVQQWRYPYI